MFVRELSAERLTREDLADFGRHEILFITAYVDKGNVGILKGNFVLCSEVSDCSQSRCHENTHLVGSTARQSLVDFFPPKRKSEFEHYDATRALQSFCGRDG